MFFTGDTEGYSNLTEVTQLYGTITELEMLFYSLLFIRYEVYFEVLNTVKILIAT